MKARFFAIAALVLGMVSCAKDFAPEANYGGEVDFTLAVSAPELAATRAGVDGQVLVVHDMIGMTHEFSPKFLRRYMNLYEDMTKAIGQYVDDVKSKDFPNSSEQY